jgi:hypothetical protein
MTPDEQDELTPEAIELMQLVRQFGDISPQVARHIVEMMLSTLSPNDDLAPFLYMQTGDGKSNFVPIDAHDRESQCGAITSTLQRFKATGACYVATAWTVMSERSETISPTAVKPSLHPDRVEVVICYLMSREHESTMLFGEIERASDKPPRITKWEQSEAGDPHGGPFVDALRDGLR